MINLSLKDLPYGSAARILAIPCFTAIPVTIKEVRPEHLCTKALNAVEPLIFPGCFLAKKIGLPCPDKRTPRTIKEVAHIVLSTSLSYSWLALAATSAGYLAKISCLRYSPLEVLILTLSFSALNVLGRVYAPYNQ